MQARVRRAIPLLMVVFFMLNTLVVIATVLFQQQDHRSAISTEIWPVIFPAAALVALIASWYLQRIGREFWSFVASGAMIALLLISGAVGMFPNLLISTIDPQFNLTSTMRPPRPTP